MEKNAAQTIFSFTELSNLKLYQVETSKIYFHLYILFFYLLSPKDAWASKH